jgi:hypothetical protein
MDLEQRLDVLQEVELLAGGALWSYCNGCITPVEKVPEFK